MPALKRNVRAGTTYIAGDAYQAKRGLSANSQDGKESTLSEGDAQANAVADAARRQPAGRTPLRARLDDPDLESHLRQVVGPSPGAGDRPQQWQVDALGREVLAVDLRAHAELTLLRATQAFMY